MDDLVGVPDPGRTIFSRALPEFVRTWVKEVRSPKRSTDDLGDLVRTFDEQETLPLLVEDPEVARGLQKVHANLAARGATNAKRRVLELLAHACFAHGVSRRRIFEAKGHLATDFRSAAKACRRLANTLQSISSHSRGADTIAYLIEVIRTDVRTAARRRRGLRGGRYTIDALVRLPTLLETFAAVLEEDLRDRRLTASGSRTHGGVLASRRYQIDHLIRHADVSLGYVPYALIAAIVSTANNAQVDESVVRKRRTAIRKIRP